MALTLLSKLSSFQMKIETFDFRSRKCGNMWLRKKEI